MQVIVLKMNGEIVDVLYNPIEDGDIDTDTKVDEIPSINLDFSRDAFNDAIEESFELQSDLYEVTDLTSFDYFKIIIHGIQEFI